ncbi:ricin-type beta-trefoil lectin domain protein [Actinoallomurus sp. NPDC050550]|uniref:ricin-type beta-trefoil lectin domain protein n=1 Tax=Actinoallomurus sp. NPDC050550 TaxID=3154937 RepID=UPI0033EE4848
MRKRSMAAVAAAATALLVPALAATPASAASSFHFLNEESWSCIVITSTAANAQAHIKKCDTSTTAKRKQLTFQVKWGNHLVNAATGKCLDINLGKNKKLNSGDAVVTNTCKQTAANQKWSFTGDGVVTIEHIHRAREPYVFIAEAGTKNWSNVIVQTQGYPVPDRQIWHTR